MSVSFVTKIPTPPPLFGGSPQPSRSGHLKGVNAPPLGGKGAHEHVRLDVDRPVHVEANARPLVYCSLVPDDQAALEDAFSHPSEDQDVYALPPFALFRKMLSRAQQSRYCSMTLVTPLWTDRASLTVLRLLPTHQPLALPLWVDALISPTTTCSTLESPH